jgi:hypothetical protein
MFIIVTFGVAHEAGLNGWQLDRLIYNTNDAALAALTRVSARQARVPAPRYVPSDQLER